MQCETRQGLLCGGCGACLDRSAGWSRSDQGVVKLKSIGKWRRRG
jgi:hypothetical protein